MISIFCFYNQSSGVQASLAFSKTFKHCNIITYDGIAWICTEIDLHGIHPRYIDAHSGVALIRGLKIIKTLVALVVVDVDERFKSCWKPFIVRSCNEFDRYISGVDIGFTFNPKHLYNKLLDKHTNYDILYTWSRDGVF